VILIIDNYDSFTGNIVQYLRELGATVEVTRNDAISAADARANSAQAFLISPGPGEPRQAGVSLDLVAGCAANARPLLGVRLGHQAIGESFAGAIVRAHHPDARQDKCHPSRGIGRVHGPALAVHGDTLSFARGRGCTLVTNAHTVDGTIMGLRHRVLPIDGVQLHPESIASEYGHQLLANFLALAGVLTA
jgi:anthranilate synthase component 2